MTSVSSGVSVLFCQGFTLLEQRAESGDVWIGFNHAGPLEWRISFSRSASPQSLSLGKERIEGEVGVDVNDLVLLPDAGDVFEEKELQVARGKLWRWRLRD